MARSTSLTHTTTASSWCIRSSASALLIAAVAIAGCDPPEPSEPVLLPGDYAERFEEVRDCRFSVEHDAVYIRILAPPEVASWYRDGVYPFAEGALIVKEEHRTAACDDILGWTIMQRLADGERPEHADWAWQRLDAELMPIEIEPKGCVSCHTACTMGRDYACADP